MKKNIYIKQKTEEAKKKRTHNKQRKSINQAENGNQKYDILNS